MTGNSVVPGLPNRCVIPSSFSNARNAERPVMRFFMKNVSSCPRLFPPGSDNHGRSGMVRSMDWGHGWDALRLRRIGRVIRVARGLAAIERCAVVGRDRMVVLQPVRQVRIGNENAAERDGVGVAVRDRGIGGGAGK